MRSAVGQVNIESINYDNLLVEMELLVVLVWTFGKVFNCFTILSAVNPFSNPFVCPTLARYASLASASVP